MVDDKLIEIINNLKNKRLSDIEITDILLQDKYTKEEIKENLNHYNKVHGIVESSYLDEYQKIHGKKEISKTQNYERKDTVKKPVKEKKVSSTKKVNYKRVILIFMILIILGAVYFLIDFGIIDVDYVIEYFKNLELFNK